MSKIIHKFNEDRKFFQTPNFDHIEIGMIGVNGQPYVNFEAYLDTTPFQQLHQEIVFGLAQVDQFDHGFIIGEVPPEFKVNIKTSSLNPRYSEISICMTRQVCIKKI